MMKKLGFLLLIFVFVGIIPVLAVTISQSGTLTSTGGVENADNGDWLSICGRPGSTASFQIDYVLEEHTCGIVGMNLLIAGSGPVANSHWDIPYLPNTITYETEFPESGRMDFFVYLICPVQDTSASVTGHYSVSAQAPGNGTCPDESNKITVCHIPEDNPDAAHTIEINRSALESHFSHGDYLGECIGN